MKKIDYEYYEWLISQIHTPSGKSYGELYDRMHNIEFVWMIPNDDNRIQDGLDLRYEFLNGKASSLILEGATFLEVLIGLSRRVAFTAGGNSKHWAWRLIKNLRLSKMSDPLTEKNSQKVDDILETVIWRTYDFNGQGGFFPLMNTLDDQRKIEIWYQLNAFVMEKS